MNDGATIGGEGRAAPSSRTRLRRVLKWIIGVIAALLVVCVVLLIFKDGILRKFAEYSVERETGLEASIGGLHLDMTGGSVRVTDFRLHNPPGFGEGPLLHMPELFLEVDRAASTNGTLRFREARVHLSEFSLVRNAEGQTNIVSLQERLSRKPRKKKGNGNGEDVKFAGIGELRVSVGKVRYEDMKNPQVNQSFIIGITNEVVKTINSEKDLKEWATAFLIRIVIQQALLKPRNQPSIMDMLRPPPPSNGTNR